MVVHERPLVAMEVPGRFCLGLRLNIGMTEYNTMGKQR